MEYLQKEDGITHINIYSKGKTQLGKFASNFAFSPFKCEDGEFDSVEGYWYWLSVPKENAKREDLRKVSGFAAKKLGRELRGKDWIETEEFKKKIISSIRAKFESNTVMLNELKNSTLPFTHYYVFYGEKKNVDGGKWILEFFEEFRNSLKVNKL